MSSSPASPAEPPRPERRATVNVCIVTYKTAELVKRCLQSLWRERQLAHAAGIDLRIVVVDNDSGDAATLAKFVDDENAGAFTHIVRAEKNGGFAYGNNVAIRFAYESGHVPDFFWLLNPDTEVLPRSSVELVQFLRAQPSVGIAGSRLEFADGEVWPYAFRFHTPLSELDTGLRLGLVAKLLSNHIVLRKMTDEPTVVDWLPGASMMVRRQLVEAIGGMDEEYFLYYEETDYCRRIKEAGYTVNYVPASRVMHIAGGSTGVTTRRPTAQRLPSYWFASRSRYFQKNFGLPSAIAADAVFVGSACLGNLKLMLKGQADQIVPHQIRDVLAHSPLLRRNRVLSPARNYRPKI